MKKMTVELDIRPPLAGWRGGKCRLSKRIVGMLPGHCCYCEPFAGAAWVLFRKPESRVEVINDINIVTLYRVLQNHLEEFIRYFKWVLVSRDEFDRLKKVDPDTLTDIQRSARFYYMQKLAFSGQINRSPAFGYAATSRPKLNLLRIEEDLSAVHLRLARVYIECLPYDVVISKYDKPETFFYLDPPYWGFEGHYGKGLFTRDEFGNLANVLAKVEGRFVLSINDLPETREIFSEFTLEEAQVSYTCGKGRNQQAKELLVRNF